MSDILASEIEESKPLVDFDKRKESWDVKKKYADQVSDISREAVSESVQKQGKRISMCASGIQFEQQEDGTLKLRKANFCRVRHCPVCQWRRSLMWRARFYDAIPDLIDQYPQHRWLFLTLTVKNCHVTELREQIQKMNKAWHRLLARASFKPVEGWVRAIEVTKQSDNSGYAHPHFHVILMVSPSYFKGDYLTREKWASLWQDALKVNYSPVVDIRIIRKKKRSSQEANSSGPSSVFESVKTACLEVFKYSVKPSDMLQDKDWFFEMVLQLRKLRFLSSGGLLKKALHQGDVNREMVECEEGQESDEKESQETKTKYNLLFSWNRLVTKYLYNKRVIIPIRQ